MERLGITSLVGEERMMNRPTRNEGGFVITIEFILIVTILCIGTLVGVVAVRNALLEWRLRKIAVAVNIYDSTVPPIRIGVATTFDMCETPQILAVDSETAKRALVGVRSDRFTSRDRIYYEAANCGGDGYIASPGRNLLTTVGTLPVAILNEDQGRSYGVGPSFPGVFGRPGLLLRDTGDDVSITAASMWASQLPDCALPADDLTLGTSTQPDPINVPQCYNIDTPILLDLMRATEEVESVDNSVDPPVLSGNNQLEGFMLPFYAPGVLDLELEYVAPGATESDHPAVFP